jgi:Na+/H+-translocating membrane pyrophosphatase
MIGRVMLTVFVPILLGVAAGMVTYLLGMLIGAVVAAVYMKIRGRKARYQAVALEEEDFEIDDDEETVRGSMEKDGFKDEEVGEAPPVYVEKE